MRLIDGEALEQFFLDENKRLRAMLQDEEDEEERQYIKSFAPTVEWARKTVHHMPTIEARPVARGEWEPRKDVIGFVRCSVCHDCNVYDDWPDGKKWNYCPNCGADMRGEKDG